MTFRPPQPTPCVLTEREWGPRRRGGRIDSQSKNRRLF